MSDLENITVKMYVSNRLPTAAGTIRAGTVAHTRYAGQTHVAVAIMDTPRGVLALQALEQLRVIMGEAYPDKTFHVSIVGAIQ